MTYHIIQIVRKMPNQSINGLTMQPVAYGTAFNLGSSVSIFNLSADDGTSYKLNLLAYTSQVEYFP